MLVSNTLPATATRTDWQFTFLPNADPNGLSDGTLSITEDKGKRVKRTITTAYGIQEQPCRHGRAFLLVKLTHAGDLDTVAGKAGADRCGEVYSVTVTGQQVKCTCPAGSTEKSCKHGIAMKELLATADLPSPCSDTHSDHRDTERQPPTSHPSEYGSM